MPSATTAARFHDEPCAGRTRDRTQIAKLFRVFSVFSGKTAAFSHLLLVWFFIFQMLVAPVGH